MHWLHLGFPSSGHGIRSASKYICSLVRWQDKPLNASCISVALLSRSWLPLAGNWPRPPRRSTKIRQSRTSSSRPLADSPTRDMGIQLGMSCNIHPQPAVQRSVKWHEAVALLGLRADKLTGVLHCSHAGVHDAEAMPCRIACPTMTSP
jgi:hypothetical protein